MRKLSSGFFGFRLVLLALAVSSVVGALMIAYRYVYEQGYAAGTQEASAYCKDALAKARAHADSVIRQRDELAKRLRDDARKAMEDVFSARETAKEAVELVRASADGPEQSGCVLAQDKLPEWVERVNRIRGK